MWPVVRYVGCCMLCGLLYGIWAAGYNDCSICGLLNGMWAVVVYVDSCMPCGLLYGMWAVVWCMGCWI